MMWRAPALLALASVACSSPAMLGAEAAPAGREPSGRRIASFRATACVDAQGGAFDHPTRVTLLEDAAKRRMLVVARPSYDSLVIRQAWSEGGESVYQLILEDGEGARVLQDFRLPQRGDGDGRMAASREFTQSPGAPGQVVAKVARPAFACRLAVEKEAGE